jgi:hypothetical protein
MAPYYVGTIKIGGSVEWVYQKINVVSARVLIRLQRHQFNTVLLKLQLHVPCVNTFPIICPNNWPTGHICASFWAGLHTEWHLSLLPELCMERNIIAAAVRKRSPLASLTALRTNLTVIMQMCPGATIPPNATFGVRSWTFCHSHSGQHSSFAASQLTTLYYYFPKTSSSKGMVFHPTPRG